MGICSAPSTAQAGALLLPLLPAVAVSGQQRGGRVRDKDVLKDKYYISKTLKAPNPMRFSSPVTSGFPLVFLPSPHTNQD